MCAEYQILSRDICVGVMCMYVCMCVSVCIIHPCVCMCVCVYYSSLAQKKNANGNAKTTFSPTIETILGEKTNN